MRGLTVKQPWAWAIVHGGKDVENRSRSLGPYRGPVAIHAGLTDDPEAPPNVIEMWSSWWEHMGRPPVPRGYVIGVVDLVDVHHALRTTGSDEPTEMCSEWAQDGDLWHLVLANPRPLATPIPWRGALGLWTVPADLEAAIREQVSL